MIMFIIEAIVILWLIKVFIIGGIDKLIGRTIRRATMWEAIKNKFNK